MTEVPEPDPPIPPWQRAVADLVSARAELFSLEAGEAGKRAAVKGGLGLGAVISLVLTWVFLAAGLIGWIAAALQAPWYFVALGAAGLHLLIAVIAGALLSRPGPPSFPLTRNELAKDRAWIAKLQQPRKP